MKNRMEKFMVSAVNENAYRSAKEFVALKKACCMLFIYGKSGCGKTYLTKILKEDLIGNGTQVMYRIGEDMISELIVHVQSNRTQAEFYQEIKADEVLIVDDIHYLEGKEYGQKYLATVWLGLLQNGVRIVLTADKKIEEFKWLHDILDVFQGTIEEVEIEDADMELKKKILGKLEEEWQEELSDEEKEEFAKESKNLCQLEGLFKRVMAWRRLLNKE